MQVKGVILLDTISLDSHNISKICSLLTLISSAIFSILMQTLPSGVKTPAGTSIDQS